MVNWSYPYVHARARGILSRMISPSQLEDILKGDITAFLESDITKFLELLLNTSYSDGVAGFNGSGFSIVDFEHDSIKKLLNRIETIISIRTKVPPKCMRLVNFAYRKFEARNIKQALRILHFVETEGKEVPEELKKLFVPIFYPPEYYERFLELGSIARGIEVIRDTRLRKALIEAYEDYKSTNEYSLLEARIDKTIYTDLRDLVKNWPLGSKLFSVERFPMYRLVSEEIDLVNVAIVMRCLLAGMDFTDYLLPANFALGDEFCSILGMETVTEILAVMARTPYRHVVEQIVSGDERDALYEFEILSKRYIAKRIKNLFSLFPLSMTSVYSFVELELYQLEDIITIFVGKLNDLDPEVIKSSLILLGVYER